MESLKSENLSKTCCNEKIALIHVSQSEIIEQVTWGTVFEFVKVIKLFLLRNIRDSDTCIGILIDKNILVPSLIISFQDLNYSFIFLTTSKLVDHIKSLNIKWILSVDIEPPTDNFTLKETIKLSAGEVYLWLNGIFIENQTHNLLQNTFCIVETSGSTGESKRVHVSYNCIENNVKSVNKHFGVTSIDNIYWGTPLTFDPTLVELILGISNQATLVIVSKLVALNPTLLYGALFKIGSTTFLQVVPSVFLRWDKQQIHFVQRVFTVTSYLVVLPLLLVDWARQKFVVKNVREFTE